MSVRDIYNKWFVKLLIKARNIDIFITWITLGITEVKV